MMRSALHAFPMLRGMRSPALRAAVMGLQLPVLLLVGACAHAPLAPVADGASPTGGVGLTLWYGILSSGQYQYFQVTPAGGLSYGGGMAAFNRKVEWTGTLDAQQGKQVRAIIDDAGWMTAPNPAHRNGESPVAEFVLIAGDGQRRFTITGEDPKVQELVTCLQQAAEQRFDSYMQRLPEAGPQRPR